ncbi:acyl-CoA dehydrogenase family protein [Saccharothrix sp. NPDC042600]|uniref:acyl-CoA dehydrogenase family protein n=1 Tax=Saccharothrix TaxID=2071 RepID=UPI0033EB1A3B|nr:acyl-CoA dehydrogenase family protein [Saccharothrix mutabilis subsp. capreolus]
MTTLPTAEAAPFTGLWPGVDDILSPESLREVAAGAVAADRDGRLATAGLDLLRANGWPGLVVPRRFGGAGEGLTRACAAQRALATADPGLAIAVNMHLLTVSLMAHEWRRHPLLPPMLEQIAARGLLVASAVAEPQLGGAVARSTLRATRVADGWRLSGRKTPCSLAAHADLAYLQLEVPGDGDSTDLVVTILPTTTPGLTVEHTWDTLGMRGSGSDTLVLADCHIPDDRVFYRAPVTDESDPGLAVSLVWFGLITTSVYLGVAQAALATARELLGRLRISHLDAVRRELPSFQQVVGRHVAALLELEAACAGLAAAVDNGCPPHHVLPAVLGVKLHAVRVVPDAVAALVEACGGAAYARSTPLERLWRDAQAIRFHPPTPAAVRQYLGRTALGVPTGLDLDERPTGRVA